MCVECLLMCVIVGGSQGQWLTPEMLSLFMFHNMRPLSLEEELHIIRNLVCQYLEQYRCILKIVDKLQLKSFVILIELLQETD